MAQANLLAAPRDHALCDLSWVPGRDDASRESATASRWRRSVCIAKAKGAVRLCLAASQARGGLVGAARMRRKCPKVSVQREARAP